MGWCPQFGRSWVLSRDKVPTRRSVCVPCASRHVGLPPMDNCVKAMCQQRTSRHVVSTHPRQVRVPLMGSPAARAERSPLATILPFRVTGLSKFGGRLSCNTTNREPILGGRAVAVGSSRVLSETLPTSEVDETRSKSRSCQPFAGSPLSPPCARRGSELRLQKGRRRPSSIGSAMTR
jgi:hypothetical protein